MPFRTDNNTGNSPASVPPRSHVPCPSVQITSLGTHLHNFLYDLTYHALLYRSQHRELTCVSSGTISRTMPFRSDHNTGNSLAHFRHDLMYHALPYRSQHRELTCVSSATISRTMPFRSDHNTGNSPASVPPRPHVPCPSVHITTPGTHMLQFRHNLTHHALP